MNKTLSIILSLGIIIILLVVTWIFLRNRPGNENVNGENNTQETQKVTLYYYNAERDRDESENILCSEKGLVGVPRVIQKQTSNIEDTLQKTIEALLRGELNEEERAQGITTEYPLSGLSLKNTFLQNGILTLTFEDPQNKTTGGSCRVSILWKQIEKTAKQFSEVTEVRFLPEEIFQP